MLKIGSHVGMSGKKMILALQDCGLRGRNILPGPFRMNSY